MMKIYHFQCVRNFLISEHSPIFTNWKFETPEGDLK